MFFKDSEMDTTSVQLRNLENKTTLIGIAVQRAERKANEALSLNQSVGNKLTTRINCVDDQGTAVSDISAVISGEGENKQIVFKDKDGYLDMVDPITEFTLPLSTTGEGAGNFSVDTNGQIISKGGLVVKNDEEEKFTVDANGNVIATSVSDGTNSLGNLAESLDGLKTVVGDSSSGLVQDVNTLKTTVGDSSSGLVKDVGSLEEAVSDAVLKNPPEGDTQTVNGKLEATDFKSGNITIGDSNSPGFIDLNTKRPEQAGYTSLGAIRNVWHDDETLASFAISAQDYDDERRDYLRTYGENVGLQLESNRDIVIQSRDGITIDTENITVECAGAPANITVDGNITVNGTVTSNNVTVGDNDSNGYINLNTKVPGQAGGSTSLGGIIDTTIGDDPLASFTISAQDVDGEKRDYLRTYGEFVGFQLETDKDIVIQAQDGLRIDSATTTTGDVTVGSMASQANVNVNGTLTTISGEKTMTVNGEGIDLTQTSSGEEYKLLRLYMDNGGAARVEAGTYNLELKAANELDLKAQMINLRSSTQAHADMWIGTEEKPKDLTVNGNATIGITTDSPGNVLTVNGGSKLIGTTIIGTPSYNAYLEVNGDIISTSNSFKLGNLYMSYNQYDGIITFSDPKLGKSASITLN